MTHADAPQRAPPAARRPPPHNRNATSQSHMPQRGCHTTQSRLCDQRATHRAPTYTARAPTTTRRYNCLCPRTRAPSNNIATYEWAVVSTNATAPISDCPTRRRVCCAVGRTRCRTATTWATARRHGDGRIPRTSTTDGTVVDTATKQQARCMDRVWCDSRHRNQRRDVRRRRYANLTGRSRRNRRRVRRAWHLARSRVMGCDAARRALRA